MPSVSATADLLTVEDYRATPEGSRFQLVEGELIMAPAPNLHHQRIVRNLSQILNGHVAQSREGEVLFAPCDVFLSPHDVVRPDVLFVTRGRLGILAEDGVHGAPELVIEVLSPASALLDKKQKRRLYARAGVKEMWLVDPLLLQIQIYDFARDAVKPARLIEEDDTLSTPLLPGLALSAASIFAG